jgi:ribosomal protein L40E
LPVPATPATSVKVGTGICSECGTKNPPSGNYCKRCGKQL